MTLETLLARACVSRYDGRQWFSACAFDGQNLLCWDIDDYGVLDRCWLAKLREVVPTLALTFVTSPRPPISQKPRASAFKKGYEPIPQDML